MSPDFSGFKKIQPSENDIVTGSHEDTLYNYPFAAGNYLNIYYSDDGDSVEFQISPKVKISLVHINNRPERSSLVITKYKLVANEWIEDSKVSLSNFGVSKLKGFIELLSFLDIDSLADRRLTIGPDFQLDANAKQNLELLLKGEGGEEVLQELLASDLTGKDLVNIGYRKKQLLIFEKLLNEDNFIEQYKLDNNLSANGEETAWQHFFETNPWIFGYGLNYIWCNNMDNEKLEQVVSGYTAFDHGKRTDALMTTQGAIKSFVLAEIKTPNKKLLKSDAIRSGCYQVHTDLTEGVAQIQTTVKSFMDIYKRSIELTDNEGNPVGSKIYNISPRTYLIIGSLDQFNNDHGTNDDKFSSFELFRQSISKPEIITFDELYERTKAIIENN